MSHFGPNYVLLNPWGPLYSPVGTANAPCKTEVRECLSQKRILICTWIARRGSPGKYDVLKLLQDSKLSACRSSHFLVLENEMIEAGNCKSDVVEHG